MLSPGSRRFLALFPLPDAPATLAASADGLSWEPLPLCWGLPADAALAVGPDDSLWAAYRDDDGPLRKLR